MVTKVTKQYAFHDVSLKCEIYENQHQTSRTPVLLYFHPGSLTGGTRELISPWLVQACMQRQWPVISASYRFLPQVSAQGIVDDALAAYAFAQTWQVNTGEPKRRVILAGASAGFFMANMIPHHFKDESPPLAMLCITGVPSFQHPYFNSSTLLSPKPITYEKVRHWIEGPLCAGDLPAGECSFEIAMLGEGSDRNPAYVSPEVQPATGLQRWDLFDYYLYENSYPKMLGSVDPGSAWARNAEARSKLEHWPPSVFIQGQADTAVPLDVITQVVDQLGPDKATLFLAAGQPHLFESSSFWEDQTPAMDVVRAAMKVVDQHVVRAMLAHCPQKC